MSFIAKIKRTMPDGEERLFLVRAATRDLILYDCEFPYDRAGRVSHPPAVNCAMSPKGFAARTGWSAP